MNIKPLSGAVKKVLIEKLEAQASTECANYEEHRREHDRYKQYAADHEKEMKYWETQYGLTRVTIKTIQAAEVDE